MTICTIRIKEKRWDCPYHFGKLSYIFIEMHWKWTFQGQITLSKTLIFLTFYWKISEQIQWCSNQIMVFSILEWSYIVKTIGVLICIFLNFPVLPESYKKLHLRIMWISYAVLNKYAGHYFKVLLWDSDVMTFMDRLQKIRFILVTRIQVLLNSNW